MRKKCNFLAFFICFLMIFTLFGCNNKEIDYATLKRDDANIGGSLTFVYDSSAHIAYFGGENQVVQYYDANVLNNNTAGCRVGVKIIAPTDIKDFSKATLIMNKIEYTEGSFLETVDGEIQNFANIYPVVSPDANKIKFIIKWGDKIKEQEYEIIIVEGTLFMNEKGEVSSMTYEEIKKKDGQPKTENA